MRLFSIAEEAISHGIPCDFVGDFSEVAWLENRAQTIGFEKILSVVNYESLNSNSVLIIDSYESEKIDSFVKNHIWSSIIAISDSHTPKFESDLVIHPGLNATWFEGDSSKLLSGFDYIPLRKSITKLPVINPASIDKIVVIGGGTDSLGFGNSLARILSNFSQFGTVTFFSAERDGIQSIDTRFVTREFGLEIDDVVAEANLVFTTSGTSSLETLARGLPTGIACAVQNQEDNYSSLHHLGVAAQIGERLGDGTWRFEVETISRLILDSKYREQLITKSQNIIDLMGSNRIVGKIVETLSSR
jgi:spore coat polysaccharide biosynthesis predicted glycosyltransferase SpsG